jgi:hypothetical protein
MAIQDMAIQDMAIQDMAIRFRSYTLTATGLRISFDPVLCTANRRRQNLIYDTRDIFKS